MILFFPIPLKYLNWLEYEHGNRSLKQNDALQISVSESHCIWMTNEDLCISLRYLELIFGQIYIFTTSWNQEVPTCYD